MSQIERGYYPLSTVETRDIPKIDFALNLPEYVNTDKIGINIRRIHMMMRLGGINSLRVVGSSGEVETSAPSIVGHGSDGSAYAGTRAAMKKVPSYTAEREKAGMPQTPYLAGRWVDAKVEVNLSQMQDKLSQAGKLRSAEAWGQELNKAITQGIVEEGIKHVIFDLTPVDYVDLGFANVYPFFFGDSVEEIVGYSLAYHTFYNIWHRMFHKRGGYSSDFRWSVFSGPQFDRQRS